MIRKKKAKRATWQDEMTDKQRKDLARSMIRDHGTIAAAALSLGTTRQNLSMYTLKVGLRKANTFACSRCGHFNKVGRGSKNK